MKYSKDEILYFKPSYNEQIKYCRICQIVKYLEDTKQYLVIASDIYCPYHYCKCVIYEEDLDNIENTFLVNETNINNNESSERPACFGENKYDETCSKCPWDSQCV